MARQFRVFIEPVSVGQVVRLRPEDAHHLARVLRLAAGTPATGFDGRGRVYEGVLTELDPRGGALRVDAVREVPPPGPPRLELAVAMIRLDAFEWLVQKAVELGGHRFQPLVAERCSRGQGLAVARARLDRWRRIGRESLKQCRRNFEMELAPPLSARDYFAQAGREGGMRFLLHPDATPLAPCPDGEPPPPTRNPDREPFPLARYLAGEAAEPPERITTAAGPEGGWSEGEVQAAEAAGFVRFSLGDNILRTETAALAALTLFQGRYHWSNVWRGMGPRN
jgi:16S rRNA (uracil1498-N3)-methyltransferase